jgi:hypothetical protein
VVRARGNERPADAHCPLARAADRIIGRACDFIPLRSAPTTSALAMGRRWQHIRIGSVDRRL